MPIIVFRHGDDNDTKNESKKYDKNLSSKGKEEIIKKITIASKLYDPPLQIYTSPFVRCKESALISLNIYNKLISIEIKGELSKYIYEVSNSIDLERHFSNNTLKYIKDPFENKFEVMDRLSRFFDSISNDKIIYVFTHSFAIKLLKNLYSQKKKLRNKTISYNKRGDFFILS